MLNQFFRHPSFLPEGKKSEANAISVVEVHESASEVVEKVKYASKAMETMVTMIGNLTTTIKQLR